MFAWAGPAVASGCGGRGRRSSPFLRIDARRVEEQAPSVSARRPAASRRSSPALCPSRMLPQHDRNPCGGCGREASIVATTCAVAAVAHELIDGFSWSAAFVLGAIVSPTDPLAAVKITRRLGVPRRIVAVIEGESLVNDGSALVLYKVAVAAVVAGSFSMWEAGLRFLWSVAGGIGSDWSSATWSQRFAAGSTALRSR